jgi:tetratricopeptide (TPR) repeat protein
LRLLALHPGHVLDTYAAAALTDTDTDAASQHLRQLCGDHLLQSSTPGRFVFHDLVRAYAADRAIDEDRPSARRAALTRLFDYYLSTAGTAMDILHPADAHRRPRRPPTATPIPALTDPDTARGWLDTERPTLAAAVGYTVAHGWSIHTVQLASTLYPYLRGGHNADALAIHGYARDAAQHSGDREGQAQALNNLGATHGQVGRYGPATAHLRQALALFRQTGDRVGEAHALNNLGLVEAWLGQHGPAADHLHQALTLLRQTGDRVGEAHALDNLGSVETRLGQHGPAADHLHQALTLFLQVGDRTGEAFALNNLGVLHTRLDQSKRATEYHRQALTLFRGSGDRFGEATVLNGLGQAARTGGHPADALAHHTAALTIAADTGGREQQARAHTGLGHAHYPLGNFVRAREHYVHALALYTDLGSPQADDVRTHLAALDSRTEQQR